MGYFTRQFENLYEWLAFIPKTMFVKTVLSLFILLVLCAQIPLSYVSLSAYSPVIVSKSDDDILPSVKTGCGAKGEELILRWRELAGNISFLHVSLYQEEYLPKLYWLYRQGVEFLVSVDWRPEPVSSSMENPNPLDFYYDEAFRNQVYDHLSQVFSMFPEGLASGILLGDEEPYGAYQWFYFGTAGMEWPDEISKYNGTYHAETGFWFKDLPKMNPMERKTWQEWMEERNAFAYNSMYSYLKTLYPEKSVIIAVMENYNLGFDPSLISTDERSGYAFYSKDPRQIYSGIRYAKTTYPDMPVDTTLWGSPRFGFYEGCSYSKLDFKRMAYAAYIAGADRISWFTYGDDERGRMLQNWQRTDQTGRDAFDAINEINRELMALPVFNCSPKVLEISEYDTAGESKGIGLLEWDNTNQIRASKAGFDLSKYCLVIVKDQPSLISDFVTKLNQYVEDGGNLVLLGSTGSSLTDPFGQPRPRLMIENGDIDYQHSYDSMTFTLMGDNPLKLSLELPVSDVARHGISFTFSPNHQTINIEVPEESQGYHPLVLYHDESDPDSGHVFYNGFHVDWEPYTYASTPTVQLWILSLNAFGDIIGFHEGLATEENCKTLASIASFPDRLIVGFVNDEMERGLFSAEFDFTTRGYEQRSLWLYQRDRLLEWVGEAGLRDGEMSVGITPFPAEEAVLFELLPIDGLPSGRLNVKMHPLSYTPVPTETFTIRGEVSNVVRYTEAKGVEATIELPLGIILASGEDSLTVEIGDMYPPERSGFGYPMTFSWDLRAEEEGNYTCKVTVVGDGVEPVVKYVEFEVRPHAVDIALMRPRIYVVPDEGYTLDVGVSHRGGEALHDAAIWCRFPYSDWHAPHKEQLVELLGPGERLEVSFTFSSWWERPPPWAIPGEEVLVAVASLIDGNVCSEAYGYIEVVASKVAIGVETEEEYDIDGTIDLILSIRAAGIERAEDIKIDVRLPSGIEMVGSPTLLLGTLGPGEETSLVLTMRAYSPGIYYLEFEPRSANAYGEGIVASIRVVGEEGVGGEAVDNGLSTDLLTVVITAVVSAAAMTAIMMVFLRKRGRS